MQTYRISIHPKRMSNHRYNGCTTDNGQCASGRNEYRNKSRAVDKSQMAEGFGGVFELNSKYKIVHSMLHRQERS